MIKKTRVYHYFTYYILDDLKKNIMSSKRPISLCLFLILSVFLSFCPTVSFSGGLRASLSLPASLWLEWWFRAYCEVSNPIQSQPESGGEEEGRGDGGIESRGGWETEGIMGVLIARSMLSGAQGALAPISAYALPVALILFLTPPSSSLSLFCTLCPSLLSFSHLRTSPFSFNLPSFFTRHMVLWVILLGRWYEVFQGLVWRNSLWLLRHSTPVPSPRCAGQQ